MPSPTKSSAQDLYNTNLIFVKGEDDSARHPKMRALLGKAQAGLIRKRFNSTEELKAELYAALVAYLESNSLLAESLYLAEYIERMGTGTLDMIHRCVGAGLSEPEFAITDGFVTTVRRKALAGRVMEEPKLQPESVGVKGQARGQVGQVGQEPESRPESEGERAKQEPSWSR